MSHAEGSRTSQTNSENSNAMTVEHQHTDSNLRQSHEPSSGQAQPVFVQALQRRKIAELEGKIEALESGRIGKERSDYH